MSLRLRIRDFVRSGDTLYASISYRDEGPYDLVPRYRRDPGGDRNGYRKLPFSGVERLPENLIDEVFRPDEAELRGEAAEVADLLAERGVPRRRVGVTGSRLLGLETPGSDVDLAIYGRDAFDAARDGAETMVEKGVLSRLDEAAWRRVHRKRSPALDYDEFVRHERRKRNRYLLRDTLVDLLFVRSRDEVDPSVNEVLEMEREGSATVRGTVTDATYGFDSPAIYRVEGAPDVYSFTHTYAGQVREGEELEARGFLVKGGEILIVGSTREAEGEYVRSLSL